MTAILESLHDARQPGAQLHVGGIGNVPFHKAADQFLAASPKDLGLLGAIGQQYAADSKPTNPKDAIGSGKLPLHLVPDSISVAAAMAFAEGASKYGAYNWRAAGVRTSIYVAALRRHLTKFWNGENCDPATGVPHLASVIACAGIILDADLCGKLNDDRPPVADMAAAMAEAEAVIAKVVAMNAGKKPHHWTHADVLPA